MKSGLSRNPRRVGYDSAAFTRRGLPHRRRRYRRSGGAGH